jgi:photosystem II stability/assembly factor-like uncharacterized protein
MRFLLFVCTLLCLFSCKKEYQPRNFSAIDLKEFKIDGSSIRSIKAIDKNTVYFAGSNGKYGFTKDSGNSWKINTIQYKDSIIPNFRSIARSGAYFFAFSIGNPALLYKFSEDTADVTYTEVHKKVFYDAIAFFDDDLHGIAIGDPTENCASILLTNDGGNSWNKLSCKKAPVFKEGEAFFAASNTNIAMVNNVVWIASGGKKAKVYKSLDYGNTWQSYDTPIVQGISSQGIYSIDFVDTNNGIIIGGDYTNPLENTANKAITTDGGKTWQLVSNHKNPNYKSCVQYVPKTDGKEIFAVGKTGVSFSNDAGKNWIKVSKNPYYSIQFVNKNVAWLSGNNKIGRIILN